MLRNVAIVSAHQTKFDGNKADERFQEICWPLVKKCMADTGLVFVPGRGIDFAITCSDDFFDQRIPLAAVRTSSRPSGGFGAA